MDRPNIPKLDPAISASSAINRALAAIELEMERTRSRRAIYDAFSSAGHKFQRFVSDRFGEIPSVKDFGAKGDGSALDTWAFQEAISSSYGKPLFVPDGTYNVGALNVQGPIQLVGPGSRTAILNPVSGNYDLFNVTSSDVFFQNLQINSQNKSGGYDFHINCGTNTLNRLDFINVLTRNSFGSIKDSGSSGFHITTRVHDYQALNHRGPGINMTRVFAFNWFERMVVDYNGVSNANFTGFYYDLGGLGAGAGGLILDDCDVLGTMGSGTAGTISSQRGYDIRNTAAVWSDQCRADTLGERGWNIQDVNKIYLNGPISGLNNEHGFVLTNVINSALINPHGFGRNYIGGSAANSDGIRFVSGCARVCVSTPMIQDFTGHGIHKVAAQGGYIVFNGGYSDSNTLRGVYSRGDTPLLITGIVLANNVAGNYDLGGIFDYIQASMNTAGSIINVGPGPVVG